MQSLVITAAVHKTSRKLVNDYNFAVFYNIVNVAVHNRIGLYRLINIMGHVGVFGVVDILYAEIGLRLFCAAFC